MAVPSWARKLSKTQFLYELYKLNIRIGQIVANKPTKYRQNYGDHLIRCALQALRCAQAANSIYMCPTTPEGDYQQRRHYLIEARAAVDNISTVADIFLGLCYNVDGEKQEKLERQEEYIGSSCKYIHDLIDGVLKSDAEIAKGTKKPRAQRPTQ